MNKTYKIAAILLVLTVIFSCFGFSVSGEETTASEEFRVGTYTSDMLSGGGKLVNTEKGTFYSNTDCEGWLFLKSGSTDELIAERAVSCLNYSEPYVYFVSEEDGSFTVSRCDTQSYDCEDIYLSASQISCMYVVNGEHIYFLSDGRIIVVTIATGESEILVTDSELISFVPTRYGFIYASGDMFDYTVYTDRGIITENAEAYYVDYELNGGTLVYTKAGTDYCMSLEEAFSEYPQARIFTGYEQVDAYELFSELEGAVYTADNAGINMLSDTDTSEAQPVRIRKELSQGIQNIVRRAKQMLYINWTPLKDVIGWESFVIYEAGQTYMGLPYGQPIYASYVPWKTSLSGFIEAVNNPDSKMYTDVSTSNEIAPYYSVDCSAFVSWAWNLPARKTTATIPEYATLISKTTIAEAQVGDAICRKYKHVVLVTDIAYDENGAISFVEISESTAKENTDCCCIVTSYGEGCELSLADLQQKYFGDGYSLYRSLSRDAATYSHDCAVTVEGDECNVCKAGELSDTEPFFGTGTVKSDNTFGYALAIGTSRIEKRYTAGDIVNVTASATDSFGKKWYLTSSGQWIESGRLTVKENSVCTEWSEEYPTDFDGDYIEQKTLYRYSVLVSAVSDKEYLEGYTLQSSRWNQYNRATVLGISQWPSDFDKSSAFYKKYDISSLVTVREENYARNVSGAAAAGYVYYHYCNGTASSSPDSKKVSSTYTPAYKQFHAFYSATSPETLSRAGSCYVISGTCTCSNQYYVLKMERRVYTEFEMQYTHIRWSRWSDWGEAPISENENRRVETVVLYRYNDTDHEWLYQSQIIKADCKQKGLTSYVCATCGAQKEHYEPMTEHTPEASYRVIAPATAQSDGKEALYCDVCDELLQQRNISRIGEIKQSFTAVVCNGQAQAPFVWVYDSNNVKLTYKTDYTAVYSEGRADVGQYTVTLNFTGRYQGQKTVTYTVLPSVVTLEVTGTKNSITLSWNDLPHATGYRIYRYDPVNKRYVALKTTFDTRYTDSGLTAGRSYAYIVRAYTKSGSQYYWGASAKILTATAR